MTIFECLEYRAIIAGDEDLGIFITWNGAATFNCFLDEGGKFSNVDAFTHSCKSFVQAEKAAENYLKDLESGEDVEPVLDD